MGVLSWLIEEGDVDGVDLKGLPVALACRYSDDEPGSPWTWVLYLDAGASGEQRAALQGIFTVRLGGDAERHQLVVKDGALAFDYRGVCGYGLTFDYLG